MTRTRLALIAVALAACGREARGPAATATTSQALFENGGFEAGDLSSWTVEHYINPSGGIPNPFPPPSVEALHLSQTGGYLGWTPTDLTYARAGTTGATVPAGLSAGASLRFPLHGSRSAVINELGWHRNVNSITQSHVAGAADVDPADGRVHVRFAIAPILENPSHPASEQPYYFFVLRNLTRGYSLLQRFHYANEPGVPWHIDNSVVRDPSDNHAFQVRNYTDWQLFDVGPGPAGLDIGDTVELQVFAAGCSRGGHFGEVYVDSFGAFMPSPTVVASGPTSAHAGSDITYDFLVKNGGTAPAEDVTVREALPEHTTFVSATAPAGVTCTTPAVGDTGTVSCQVGTLNPAASASLSVTVRIDPTATGTIVNGDYSISATDQPTLLGPTVETAITADPLADLSVTVSNGQPGLAPGQSTTYTVVVSNAGPAAANGVSVTGATLAGGTMAGLTGITWTCAGTGTCGAASGSGALAATANLPAGTSVTYSVTGAVGSGTAISYTATVTPPGGVTDSDTSDNSWADADPIGTLRTLTATKAGAGLGRVVSSPAAIDCGASCSEASADFVSGASVALTAIAEPYSTFAGWSGGGCSGTAVSCTVPVSAPTSVTATFTPYLAVAASGPAQVNQGGTFTYSFAVTNQGLTAVPGTTFEDALPAGTTFVALDAPGAVCTRPAPGATGTISCALGALQAGASATIMATVRADPGVSGTIVNGGYSVSAALPPAVSGPPVSTAVTAAPLADLGVTVGNGAAGVAPGQPTVYSIVVTNAGPSHVAGASVTQSVTGLTGLTWTCAASAGASCAAPSGSGALATTADLPAGTSVTYAVTGTAAASGTVSIAVTVAPPAGVTDGNPANDGALDADPVGALARLTVTRTGTGGGGVSSSPAAIQCGATCVSDFTTGTTVTFTAVPEPGSTFTGWSGGCAGVDPICTVAVTADTTVTAGFSAPAESFAVTASAPAGHGAIDCSPASVDRGGTSTCTVTPAAGYQLVLLDDNGSTVQDQVVNGEYVLANAQAAHALVATFAPGVAVTATGPSQANPGATATYTFAVANQGPATAAGAVVTDTLPAGTTFVALDAPGATCTRPDVGAAGSLSCSFGDLPPGATTTFTLTVRVDPTASGTITNGGYAGSATGQPAASGPAVVTAITTSPITDLAVTVGNGAAAIAPGQLTTYTVVVSSAGPSDAPGASVTESVTGLTGLVWNCSASGGATCAAPSGTGPLSTTADLPAGSSVTYAISGTAGASGSVSNAVTVTAPPGVADAHPANDAASDTDPVGTLATLNVTSAGTGLGTVTSTPAALACGADCSGAFAVGSSVVLTASPAMGSTFGGWSGGGCTGTSPTCTVTVGGAAPVTALFSAPGASSFTVSASAPGGHGAIACAPGTVSQGGSATCAVTPDPGYQLVLLDDNGSTVQGGVVNGQYVLADVQAPHAIAATFAPGVAVTASGPAQVNPGGTILYTFSVTNPGPATAVSATVTDALPAGTTLLSLDAPDAICTRPDVGAAGTISCDFGDLPPGASSSFTVAVRVDSAATGSVSSAAYAVSATGQPTSPGPAVTTAVTSDPLADLAATISDSAPALATGQAVTYEVVVTNAGPTGVTGASVLESVAGLDDIVWACAASGGASCAAPSGTGPIDTTADLPPGGRVVYTVSGTVGAVATVRNGVTVSPPAGVSDGSPTNNAATDADPVGALATLTVTKSGSGRGSVNATAAIECGGSCASASASLAAGTSITLTAVPEPGSTFGGWSGGGCAGTAPTCTVPISGETAVTVLFNGPGARSFPVTATSNGHGTVTCAPASVPQGSDATCTVAPASGYRVALLDDNGSTAQDGMAGDQYLISDVQRGHALTATFAALPLAAGTSCTTGAECDTGFCADGVCCDSACSGDSQACDVAGSVGTCSPVTGTPDDDDPTPGGDTCDAGNCGTSCSTNADCAGSSTCVSGTCIPAENLDARSGWGCSSGGGGTAALLLGLVAVALLRRRRMRTATTALALLALAGPARAAEPRGFALQTYEPTAPGDAFFSVPGTDARGSVTPSAGLALSWAAEPLVLKADDRAIPGAHVVHRQFWGFAQVALPIAGRVLLDATLPAALYQSGSRPFAELPGVTSAAVGDLRLGARVPLPLRLPFELAPGLDVWIPTGSRDAWTSDGTARVQPRLSLSGEAGHVSYGAALGVIVRSRRDPGFAHVGTALTYGGGVAYRFGALRVGPEFYARSRLDGTTSSPMEMLLGARWNRRWIHLGLAAGTGLNRTPGAAPLRLLFQVAVVPAPAPAAEPAPAPPPAAEPVPQPPPTAPSPEPEPAAAPPPALAAEPAPEPLAVKRGGRIELRQQVLFETGRAVIRPESAPLLREVAGVLAEHPEIVKVRIEGHTDAAGAPARNLALSRRRAEAVRRWLVEREGVDEGRLEARGYGQARPIASNGNAAGRVRNRRVDLLVVE